MAPINPTATEDEIVGELTSTRSRALCLLQGASIHSNHAALQAAQRLGVGVLAITALGKHRCSVDTSSGNSLSLTRIGDWSVSGDLAASSVRRHAPHPSPGFGDPQLSFPAPGDRAAAAHLRHLGQQEAGALLAGDAGGGRGLHRQQLATGKWMVIMMTDHDFIMFMWTMMMIMTSMMNIYNE